MYYPDKTEKYLPRHLNHSRLITPTRSHLILQRLGGGKTFNAASYSKPNKTKPPAQPNTRARKPSFEGSCAEPGSGITPAMVPPHAGPKDCAS